MPLHLLGKKSWNVYNSANIAKVKADEAAAAAREAEEERRLDEIDAQRRLAILRGVTPPPLPETESKHVEKGSRRSDKTSSGHDRKRRRLAGEDDTERDIRLAKSVTAPRDEDKDAPTLRLRKPENDAPLTDHAGNISLFPVDEKAAIKHQKNAEVEAEKKKKERELEDQYTMRFSNAAGKNGLENPWYTSSRRGGADSGTVKTEQDEMLEYPGFESKNVWGNEDPRRKERQQARISNNDPFAFMQKAQKQLKDSKRDKMKWVDEREREIRELRAATEREERRERHGKRKKRADEEDDLESFSLDGPSRHHSRQDRSNPSRHRHHRSRSRDRQYSHLSSHRYDRRRSRSRDRSRERRPQRSSHHPDSQTQYGDRRPFSNSSFV